MRRARPVVASLLALVIFLASPLSALAGCTRCPPGCPMHTDGLGAEDEASHQGQNDALHAEHGEHAAHARHGDHAAHSHGDAGSKRLIQAPQPSHAAASRGDSRNDQAHLVRARDDASLHPTEHRSSDRDAMDDCHRRARAARRAAGEDGPCITADCGQHDAGLAAALPEYLLPGVTLAGASDEAWRVSIAPEASTPFDPSAPPTEPPEHLLG